MLAVICAGVISSLPLTGQVAKAGGDYVVIPFEVPAGTAEIVFAHDDGSSANILDFGLWDQNGPRGWGGGTTEDAVIDVTESSRGYVAGPITPGTWAVVIGKAKIKNDPATYTITLTFNDAGSLAPRPRADTAPPVLRSTPGWYKGDFHVHSAESTDATATFDQIHTLAVQRGLDWVVLSDHNVVTQQALVAAYQAGVDDLLFVRGCEITTYAGHGNGLGITSYVDHRIGLDGRTIDGVLDDVAAQGGLFIINHPALHLGDVCIGCEWKHVTDYAKVAGIELHTGAYDYVPVFEREVLRRWDAILDQGFHVTGVSGSDDHRAGMDTTTPKGEIGSPTTVLYARELSEAGLMEAVRLGHAVVMLRGPDDPMVELTAVGADGTAAMVGDTIAAHHVALAIHVTGGAGTTAALVEAGQPVDVVAVDADDFHHTFERDVPEAGTRYRIQLADGANDVTITNHIFVTYVAGSGDGGCGCRAGGGGGVGGLAGLALLAWLRRRGGRRGPSAGDPRPSP